MNSTASWPWTIQAQPGLHAVRMQHSFKYSSPLLTAVRRTHHPVQAIADIGVAVIGGGLGGLTFARVMESKGLEVTVFERESSRESRGQGGVLDLHPESGQWALAQAGLDAQFRTMARAEGQDMRILDKRGKVLWDEVSPPDLMERPEVDRPALRNLLIDSLEAGTIKWNHQLVSVEAADKNGNCVLKFEDGAMMTASVVIGADGARSRVRPFVTDARPKYSGVSFIEIGIPDAEVLHPQTAETVGRGSLFALEDNKGIIAQRNGDGRIRIYIAFRMQEGDFAGLGIAFDEKPEAIRTAIVKQFEGWAPNLVDLVRACDSTFLPRPIYALPVGIRWPSQKNITLLGDAAHLMSPFAGAGANLAMQDGADLALEFAKAPNIASAISAYESRMFERAEEEARQSEDGLEMCISQDGSERFARQMWQYQNPT